MQTGSSSKPTLKPRGQQQGGASSSRPTLKPRGEASSSDPTDAMNALTLGASSSTPQEDHSPLLNLPEGVFPIITDQLSLKENVHLAAANKNPIKQYLQDFFNTVADIPKPILKKLAHEKYGTIKDTIIKTLDLQQNKAFIQDKLYFADMPVKDLKKLITILQGDISGKFKDAVNNFVENFASANTLPLENLDYYTSVAREIIKKDFETVNDILMNTIQNNPNNSNEVDEDMNHAEKFAIYYGRFVDFGKVSKNISEENEPAIQSRNQNSCNTLEDIIGHPQEPLLLKRMSSNLLRLFSHAPDLGGQELMHFVNDMNIDDDHVERISELADLVKNTSESFVMGKIASLKQMNIRELVGITGLAKHTSQEFIHDKWNDLASHNIDSDTIHFISGLAKHTSQEFIHDKWNDLKATGAISDNRVKNNMVRESILTLSSHMPESLLRKKLEILLKPKNKYYTRNLAELAKYIPHINEDTFDTLYAKKSKDHSDALSTLEQNGLPINFIRSKFNDIIKMPTDAIYEISNMNPDIVKEYWKHIQADY